MRSPPEVEAFATVEDKARNPATASIKNLFIEPNLLKINATNVAKFQYFHKMTLEWQIGISYSKILIFSSLIGLSIPKKSRTEWKI